MKLRRKAAPNDDEIMSRNKAKVVRSWSSNQWLVEEIDALAKEIKAVTGVHCDRSKLLNALAEMLIEHKEKLDKSRMVDHRTLIAELEEMLKKK